MTRHLALVGPTASGKSAAALAVAEISGDVEIVSLDSMQVYREMDIGTAKPTLPERERVVHHGLDVADPSEEWSVTRTQELVRAAVAGIEARGRRALLVGGTGLYVHAVVDGLTIPGHDDDLRAALEAGTDTAPGLAAAYDRLGRVDPAAAARIDPGNRRRIVRALEVIELTGRPFSSFGPGVHAGTAPAFDVALLGLWVPRAELARRISARFACMRDEGIVEEVRALAARARGLSRTAAQAIGYKELLGAIRHGGSLDDAFDLAIRRTRQFARRQRVWFRRDPRIVWLGSTGNGDAWPDAILAAWKASTPTSVAS